jgi:hypothetical protein
MSAPLSTHHGVSKSGAASGGIAGKAHAAPSTTASSSALAAAAAALSQPSGSTASAAHAAVADAAGNATAANVAAEAIVDATTTSFAAAVGRAPRSPPRVKRKLFLAKGFTVCRGLLSPEDVAALSACVAAQAPDEALKAQYHQHGDEHRYEYLLEAAPVRGRIDTLVRQLSTDLVPSQSFAIVSEPGAKDQPW